MKIVSLSDYKKKMNSNTPKLITFYSHIYKLPNGADKSVTTTVRIENGDVEGILRVIIENGGIEHQQDDGSYVFIPWPCAAVEIKDA